MNMDLDTSTTTTMTTTTTLSPPANSYDDLSFPDLPPFPSNVPTAPLLRLDLEKLLHSDGPELDRLWTASTELGFFYLDLRGGANNHHSNDNDSQSIDKNDSQSIDKNDSSSIDGTALLQDADSLFALGEEFYALPLAEKQAYDFAARGSYFGYKGYGKGVVDSTGTRDRNEFYNASKDDLLGRGGQGAERLPTPEVMARERSRVVVASFMRRAHAVVTLLLGLLNDRLGLPEQTLEGVHRLHAPSGDQVRWVRAPPQPQDDQKMALGEHTDFGSVSVLFNRLGGLQILPPGEERAGGEAWKYVRPLRGHCVVNLGDAMVKLTAGVLRSNLHRVVNPPGAQGDAVRYSLVYFARPENKVLLQPLRGSRIIDERRGEGKEEEEVVSAEEWILRRAFGRRAGGEWTQGTEGTKAKATL